jgi:hypothetical protein
VAAVAAHGRRAKQQHPQAMPTAPPQPRPALATTTPITACSWRWCAQQGQEGQLARKALTHTHTHTHHSASSSSFVYHLTAALTNNNNHKQKQIDDVAYAPSIDALQQVFAVYGAVARMTLTCRAGLWRALVEYADPSAAATARAYLDGHAMYPEGANRVRARGAWCLGVVVLGGLAGAWGGCCSARGGGENQRC